MPPAGMPTEMVKLTQGLVNDVMGKHPPGTQLHDDDMPGLRVVVGSKSASFKLVGRINDRTDRYVSIIIGRTNEVSLRTARERAAELQRPVQFLGKRPLGFERHVPLQRPDTQLDERSPSIGRFVRQGDSRQGQRQAGNHR